MLFLFIFLAVLAVAGVVYGMSRLLGYVVDTTLYIVFGGKQP